MHRFDGAFFALFPVKVVFGDFHVLNGIWRRCRRRRRRCVRFLFFAHRSFHAHRCDVCSSLWRVVGVNRSEKWKAARRGWLHTETVSGENAANVHIARLIRVKGKGRSEFG